MTKHALLPGILLFILSACSTQLSPPTTPSDVTSSKEDAKVAKRSAAEVTAWELSGAMAARSGSEGWSAQVNWRQHGAGHSQITLMGPLGGGTVKIEKSGQRVTYQDGPRRITSSNGEALLRKETGIALPIHALYYWVRGLPAPGAVQSKTYANGKQLQTLNQAGYTITYTAYQNVNGVILPSKIHLQGHGTTIKLVIKSWRV